MEKIIHYSCCNEGYSPIIKENEKIFIPPCDKFILPRLNTKIPKLCPELYLEFHTISVWTDANISLKVSLDELVSLLGNNDCIVFNHPERQTINQEIDVCRDLKLDAESNLNYHKDKEGLLAACGVIVRRNINKIRDANKEWLSEVIAGSIRDQLSFPYTLGKLTKIINTEWKIPYETKYFKVNY